MFLEEPISDVSLSAKLKKRNLNPYSQHYTGAMGVGVRHFDELSRSCHMIFDKSCSHDVVQLKS